jgi:prepilin-type N-terminal cleavage/methylation domain-containing protein
MMRAFLKGLPIPDRDNRGFTLIELGVAIILFCIGFVGMQKLHTAVIRGSAYSMQLTESTNEMKSISEMLIGLPYGSSSLGGEMPLNQTYVAPSRVARPSGVNYTCSWSVNQITDNLREVTVSVSWTDFDKSNHTVSSVFCK